jgi:hypothetical protein
VLAQERDPARDVVRAVAGQPRDQIDEQLDAARVQHGGGRRDLPRVAAAFRQFQRPRVHRLQADFEFRESGRGEQVGVPFGQAFGAHLGEERDLPVAVDAGEFDQQLLESRTVVERRIEEDDVARAALGDRRDEGRSGGGIERAQRRARARIEAERALRPAAADRFDVDRAVGFDRQQPFDVRRRKVRQRKIRVRLGTEGADDAVAAHGDSRQARGIASRDEAPHQRGEARFGLARHGDVEPVLSEDERIVGADLRTADDDARPRRPPSHLAGECQRALDVPQIQRQPEHVGLFRRDEVGQERVAEKVGRRRRQDAEVDLAEQSSAPRGDAERARRERHVARTAKGGRLRDRELREKEFRLRGQGAASLTRNARGARPGARSADARYWKTTVSRFDTSVGVAFDVVVTAAKCSVRPDSAGSGGT